MSCLRGNQTLKNQDHFLWQHTMDAFRTVVEISRNEDFSSIVTK